MKLLSKKITDYLMIIAGTFIFSYAIIAFWMPHGLVTGGISGLAIIILEHTTRLGFPIPVWLTNLTFNIPLFIVGYKCIPREYFYRSIFAFLVMTLSLLVAEFLPVPPTDMLLASIFGGAVGGIGVGLVLRSLATTGGTSLASVILKRLVLKYLSIPKIMFGLDTVVILLGLMVFGPVAAMYAIISIFVCTRVTDVMLEGLTFGKATFIISGESEKIAEAILRDMNRGCTLIDSRGMFTKESKPMLLCVVSPKELIHIKQLVYSFDERAFVFVADVREVLGEGFADGRNTL